MLYLRRAILLCLLLIIKETSSKEWVLHKIDRQEDDGEASSWSYNRLRLVEWIQRYQARPKVKARLSDNIQCSPQIRHRWSKGCHRRQYGKGRGKGRVKSGKEKHIQGSFSDSKKKKKKEKGEMYGKGMLKISTKGKRSKHVFLVPMVPSPRPPFKVPMPPLFVPFFAPTASPSATVADAPTETGMPSTPDMPLHVPISREPLPPFFAPLFLSTEAPSVNIGNPTASPVSAPPTRRPNISPTEVPTAAPVSARPSRPEEPDETQSPTTSISTSSPSSLAPTFAPTFVPTTILIEATSFPTVSRGDENGIGRSKNATLIPTTKPTSNPTSLPTTLQPTAASVTNAPATTPTTDEPTRSPTKKPTGRPTSKPTSKPTQKATRRPTDKPTRRPTHKPTKEPTRRPTDKSTRRPTHKPTKEPTRRPTDMPTRRPTRKPSLAPASKSPTPKPTDKERTAAPTTFIDGIAVVAARFEVDYDEFVAKPNEFASAEDVTLEYLKGFMETQFAFNVRTSLIGFRGTMVASDAASSAASYDITLVFDRSSIDTPSSEEVDLLVFAAFHQPFVPDLVAQLGNLPADNSFSKTTTVIYTPKSRRMLQPML